jgi:hypothetical protein
MGEKVDSGCVCDWHASARLLVRIPEPPVTLFDALRRRLSLVPDLFASFRLPLGKNFGIVTGRAGVT